MLTLAFPRRRRSKAARITDLERQMAALPRVIPLIVEHALAPEPSRPLPLRGRAKADQRWHMGAHSPRDVA